VELVLWLSDYREPVAPPKEMKQADVWQIHTKIDCKGESERIINFGHDGTTRRPDPLLQISATTGHNIPELLDKLSDYVGNLVTADGSEVVTNERQRQSLSHAIEPLAEIVNGVPYQEVVAECLRSAIHHLEILVGKISVEDVLGEIFSRFCIGK
jgi:tRNA modification GTPase